MSADDDVLDAVVVGAGPAGAACALRLAEAGRSVALIERGARAGAKSVSGGRLYTYAVERLRADLWRDAPWERAVSREQIMLLDGDRSMTVSLGGTAGTGAPGPDGRPQSVTVLRAGFDEWLAGRAEKAGALLATGIRVDSLIRERDRVLGVTAEGEPMRARVVIAADGVNSLLGQQAGLLGQPSPHDVGLGVKQVISLPADVIEQRFAVAPGHGSATMILGCSGGIRGGGFLYTNRESVSLGVVVSPAEVPRTGREVHRLAGDLLRHPAVRELIDGGEVVEYSAHLVREDGWRGVPRRLTGDGFVVTGEAAGFVLNLGYTVRGMDLALLSGAAAAEAVMEVLERGEGTQPVPGGVLPGELLESAYRAALTRSGLVAAMRAGEGYPDVLRSPRLYADYPGLALDLATSLFAVDGSPPRRVRSRLRSVRRARGVPVRSLLRDVAVAVRSA